MDQIARALLEAGYFRAQISTLSNFDKIIGGMAWAMQVFSQDLNLNIFYADSLDLGQKIALTEQLVMVLIVTHCPYQIEPHQLVGLDYANILPIIRWLIKRSAEIRAEHEAFNRLLALRHFHRVTNTSYRSVKLMQDEEEQMMLQNPQVSFVNSVPAFLRAKANESYGTEAPVVEDIETLLGRESTLPESEGQMDTGPLPIDEPTFVEENTLSPEEQAKQERESKELDNELVATNQKILNLIKKLDSMPGDQEISQYRQRYIELHQQSVTKNKDLKKMYSLSDSLDSTRHYLTKEINLLDSVSSNLDRANQSELNREDFLRQFSDIVIKIQSVRDEVLERLEKVREKHELLNAEYDEMLD